jgi:alpha-acetolactate decarboxylase
MNNTNSTVIDKFFFVFDKNENKLLVKNENNEKTILTIVNFMPNQEELIAREMNIEDYFNTIISIELTENLFFNDLQIQVFKNFFEDLIES